MPRSKRDKVVSLTQTSKKDKSHKLELINQVRQYADEFAYLWSFQVEHMRNNLLQEVRANWKGSKIMLGRNAVMRKALGATVEDECRLGAHKIANMLEGTVGLLFTNEPPSIVTSWFTSFTKSDFARSGNVSPSTFTLPAGPILIIDAPAPHSLEPQFRKLGLSSKLVKGVPTLDREHTVCKEGEKLNSNQVQLLKLFGKTMATFQIKPLRCVRLADGATVTEDDEIAADA